MDALAHTLDLLKDTYYYNHWIYSLLRPYIGDSVLEVGAGVGNLTRFQLYCKMVSCLDHNPEFAAGLKGLSTKHLNLHVIEARLEDYSPSNNPDHFDTILCVNVLEHIQNQEAAIHKIMSMLNPGGRLLLYVPACQWAYGTIDSHLGHFRCYTKSQFKRFAKNANATLV